MSLSTIPKREIARPDRAREASRNSAWRSVSDTVITGSAWRSISGSISEWARR